MAVIEIWHTEDRRQVPFEGPRMCLGRVDGNELVVDDPLVSRAHLAIYVEGGRYFAEDLGSSNGTKINGEHSSPHVPIALDHNSRIDVGGAALVTLLLEPSERSDDDDATVRGARNLTFRLTRSEAEVLELLFIQYDDGRPMAQIASVEEIAAARASSKAAVKQLLQSLYNKFGLHNADRNKDMLARRGMERGVTRRRG